MAARFLLNYYYNVVLLLLLLLSGFVVNIMSVGWYSISDFPIRSAPSPRPVPFICGYLFRGRRLRRLRRRRRRTQLVVQLRKVKTCLCFPGNRRSSSIVRLQSTDLEDKDVRAG